MDYERWADKSEVTKECMRSQCESADVKCEECNKGKDTHTVAHTISWSWWDVMLCTDEIQIRRNEASRPPVDPLSAIVHELAHLCGMNGFHMYAPPGLPGGEGVI